MHNFSIISYTANSTFVTVVIFFFYSIIKKIAFFAEILSKFNTTICALITNILLMITFGAYYLLYFKAVNFMGFIFIMTKATFVNFATAWRYKIAITNILAKLLARQCEKHGKIEYCNVQGSKNTGFVKFQSIDDAIFVKKLMNNQLFFKSIVKIQFKNDESIKTQQRVRISRMLEELL